MPVGHESNDLARLVDVLAGSGDESVSTSSPGRSGIVVVDLDSPNPVPDGSRSPSRDVVVVGISRSGAERAPFDLLDVALLEGTSDAPAPWVVVPDLSDAVGRLSEAVAWSPGAALTLTQVLRAGERVALPDALIVESLAYSTLQGGPEFGRWLAARPVRPARGPEARVLDLERVDDDLLIVLDRPHVRNALNAALRDALCEALALAGVDTSVSVRISGRGPDFCSGGDLDEFGTAPDPVSAHLVRTSRSPAVAVAAVAERTVVHLHGSCVGAGIEIAAAAGWVVAEPDTAVRLPEVEMGLVPGAGGTATIPRRIGRHRTAWLGLSGAGLDVGTAHSWGLVDEIAGERPG